MAPTLGQNWQAYLQYLKAGWDSHDGKPITAEAISTVASFSTVPESSGGIQMEIHRDGFDIEIEISPEGKIKSALVSLSR